MGKKETSVASVTNTTTKEKKWTPPKVKKNITLPLIKPQLDVPVYILISDKMFVGKAVKKAGDGKDMEPATLCHCIDLETEEEAQIIIPAVLKGIFEDEYQDDSYVGVGFRLTKHPKVSGKSYHNFSVAELDLDTGNDKKK